MRNRMRSKNSFARHVAIALLVFMAIGVQILPLRASAFAKSAWMGIVVINNSGRDIRHLYLTPVDRDAWGPDLLTEGTVLKTGERYTISDATCSANEIKIVAEDAEGCFVYGVVSCAQASTSWTIASDAPRDCGN